MTRAFLVFGVGLSAYLLGAERGVADISVTLSVGPKIELVSDTAAILPPTDTHTASVPQHRSLPQQTFPRFERPAPADRLVGHHMAKLADLRSADLNAQQLTQVHLESIEDASNRVLSSFDIDDSFLKVMDLPGVTHEQACLTESLYFEARGEGIDGQIAVAEVILNRVDSRKYPHTVCGVVSQGENRRNACQFSFRCDGKPETYSEQDALEEAQKIAAVMLAGRPRIMTHGATHYHTHAVSPRWSRKLEKTTEVGSHIFYKYPETYAAR
ncbi:MAG: cell wall hydrolase [Pseudomonadota bacterium]